MKIKWTANEANTRYGHMAKNAELEVPDHVGQAFIDQGKAEAVRTAKPVKQKKEDKV